MTQRISILLAAAMLLSGAAALSADQASGTSHDQSGPHGAQGSTPMMSHDHRAAAAPVTYAELQRTAEQLKAAREATAKYQDVRAAEADGYRAIGPNVPGMGVHYVREKQRDRFSISEPPILLYEREPTAPGGLRLVGVSYLLVAPAGDDGQPVGSPFPTSLAPWHKHNNVCVLPDHSATVNLTETQCTAGGGRFTAETSWMVHAWIWKDSPAGVFSPTNPLLK